MELSFAGVNWLAVGASVVAGQVISTLWFTVLFGKPWAEEYGVASSAEHTKEVPGYTYGVQLLCTVVLTLTLAMVQRWLAVDTAGEGILLGLVVAVGFVLANGIPGQAFLRRWRAAALAFGCQSVMVLVISVILAVWR